MVPGSKDRTVKALHDVYRNQIIPARSGNMQKSVQPYMKKHRNPAADLKALRRQAEALLNAGHKKRLDITGSSEEMQRLVHELAVYQIELEMQQDELLQTRAELEESLECYTDLYDFAPLGYLTLSSDGTINQVNLTATTLLGTDRTSLQGDRFGSFIAAEDLPVFNSMLERVFSTKVHSTCEVTLLSEGTFPSRSDSPVSGNGAVLNSHMIRIDAVLSKDETECRAVISDISMQKKIEREYNALKSRKAPSGKPESIDPTAGREAPDFDHNQIDKIIHARIRFAALSYLYTVHQASFVEIKKQVSTTDGNLSVHMRMLENAGYISCEKEVQARKPQTIYSITEKGHDAFLRYKNCVSSFSR